MPILQVFGCYVAMLKICKIWERFFLTTMVSAKNVHSNCYLYFYLMKKIILTLLLLLVVSSLKLSVSPKVNLGSPYQLTCTGIAGQVSYTVQNLPAGVQLVGDQIRIVDESLLVNGYYPVKVRAQDSSGAVDERIVVIVILINEGEI